MDLSEFPGHWAVVTGASAGIGCEFARQLAALGWNVVLVARRNELDDLAMELENRHRIQAVAIKLDLSDPGAAKQLRETLEARSIRIRLLCNNAATGHIGHFEGQPTEDYERMILLNTVAVVTMCREFREHLVSYSTSAIINVSSQAAYQPIPYMAVYAATKAFVHSFSQALFYEWQKDGVVVQTLVPGPTATEFDAKSSDYEIKVAARGNPSDVVRKSLNGLRRGGPIVTNASGLFKQRILSALVPPKTLLREVAKLFRPPDESKVR